VIKEAAEFIPEFQVRMPTAEGPLGDAGGFGGNRGDGGRVQRHRRLPFWSASGANPTDDRFSFAPTGPSSCTCRLGCRSDCPSVGNDSPAVSGRSALRPLPRSWPAAAPSAAGGTQFLE